MKSKSSLARKLAEEIVNVLKYNPQLTQDEKILSIELRLDGLIGEVEQSCAELHKRSEDNRVIVDERPSDIPELANLLRSSQQHRGPAN